VKPPFRVLFSNDTTNIETCDSAYCPGITWVKDPQGPRADDRYHTLPFTEAMLQATVDETSGVGIDVHLLQPGVGWVPWWKSTVYPFEEHVRFMKKHTGMDPSASGYAEYMANGGDMVRVFVERCKEKRLAPFVSFRMNDSHGHEFTDMPVDQIPSWAWHVFSPVHVEHPEWRLGADRNDWNTRVLNWKIPEVRSAKFAFIEEIIRQYDIDGFELDYMRHCNFFNQDETSSTERIGIMIEFVESVRAILDEKERVDGRHRWLCARLPAQIACLDALGLDPAAMVRAGVEMFNLSNYYYTEHQGDFAEFRGLVGDEAALYFEMCHTVAQARPPQPDGRRVYDFTIQRRTTPHQYYTGAHLAYSRGCDGASTFNFVYYRRHGMGERGPATEPPFEIHRGISDREFVARQPQHYVVSEGWYKMGLCRREIPAQFAPREGRTVTFDLAPPAGGWCTGGRLRIQSDADLGESRWTACLNGTRLAESDDRSEPYDNPYPQLLGTPAQHRAWIVPAEILRDGKNRVELTFVSGIDAARVVFVDLALE
jgi:hypothetical protein